MPRPKSKSRYDRMSVNQYVLVRAPLWDLRPDITSCWNIAVWNLRSFFCGAPSLTRGRVCNLQCNHSMVRVAQNPWPYVTISSETPPTWKCSFPYLHPPGTGWPSYTPGHWVTFTSSLTTRLLQLAGLRWRYSNPPPNWMVRSSYIYSSGTERSSSKSKVEATLRPTASQSLDFGPSPLGVKGVPSERNSIRHQEVYIKAKFVMLPLRGLHVKHAVQRGILLPTQHLLWDQGKPRKILIELAGRRTFRMKSDF
jgi:hypothetical protein